MESVGGRANLTYQKRGDTATARLFGELDHSSALSVRNSIDAIIADRHVRRIIFDLSGLNFMDSSGLGVIMGTYKRLAARGGEVAVKNVPAAINRIFDISGIYSIVKRV